MNGETDRLHSTRSDLANEMEFVVFNSEARDLVASGIDREQEAAVAARRNRTLNRPAIEGSPSPRVSND